MAETLATVSRRVQDLELKVEGGQVRSEERHKALMERLDRLAEDLSEQGRTPKPVEPRTGMAAILPESWTPMAVVRAVLFGVAVVGGAAVGGQIGGSSGGTTGAQQAVEAAVEEGKAAPVAVPGPTRVVPVPVPNPVPVPILVPVERPPNDLLPRGEP